MFFMARKRSGVRPAHISESLPLLTLANLDVLGEVLPDTVDKPTFILSIDATWSLNGLTGGEGPILVGWAHADYSDAEVEEWIENQGAWGTSDLVQQEVAKRKIRTAGEFSGVAGDEVLNDGKFIRTRMKFMLNAGQTMRFWAYNRSGAALTTGASLLVEGTAWLAK